MKDLTNKIVLITGGSSGFGKAMAKLFYQSGAKVIITGRKLENLKAAQTSIGAIDAFTADVTKPEDWERLSNYVIEKYGQLDILINNAGGGISITTTVDQTCEAIDRIISLDLNSVIYGCIVFGKLMKSQNHGTIINIASICAKHAWPKWTVYGAAKAGVLEFSKGLFVELQPFNVRVTCVMPGLCSTNFQSSVGKRPVNALLQADEVAQTVLDICKLPDHVVIEETTVFGIDQIVNPL